MNDLLSLQDLFNKKIFRIPDYQRGYSWENTQLEEFWGDVLNLLSDREHYTGMISLKKLDKEYIKNWSDENWLFEKWGYNAYHIVDGQQRLTTFIILINEIVNYYKEINEGKKISEIYINSIPLNNIIEDYLVIVKPDSANVIKSFKFGYEEDNPSYEFFKYKILDEPNQGDLNETFYTLNLRNAKKFFKDNIKKLVEDKGISALEDVFKKITLKLKFNMYYIDNDFNVFIAFETMNNRGKKLSNLELLKNRLIYLSTIFDVNEDIQNVVRKNINETWKTVYGRLGKNKEKPLNDDEFLQNHWMIYFGYTRSNKVTYDSFLLGDYFTQQNISLEKIYKVDDINIEEINTEDDVIEEPEEIKISSKREKLKIEDINNYINSMKNLITYWYQIHYPNEINNEKIKMYIERLNRLGYGNFKPLATVLLSKKDVYDVEKVECLKGMERFIFLHYRLNSYLGTYKNSFFYNLAHEFYIGVKTIDDVLKEVNTIEFLSDNNVANMSGIFTKIERLFKNYNGYYSWATIRYILYEYERFLMADKASVRILPADIFKKDEKDHYSIEHIYPQTPNNKYWTSRFERYNDSEKHRLTNTIGNLLPLSMSINSSLQNYSFDEKKNRKPRGYVDGSHNEIEVSRCYEWASREILERGLRIVEFLEKEYNFIVPNLADRKKLLGLDFMIEVNDEHTDETMPIVTDKVKDNIKSSYSEDEFEKLIANATIFMKEAFELLDKYILTFAKDIKKNTTTNYISYTNGKNFIEVHFMSNYLRIGLMSGDYIDSKNKVVRLSDTYKWSNNNRLDIYENDDLEYTKSILKQSYEKTL
ncbi:MAG: DUF262 domain-containing protein [Malacoplasma sp.]